MVQPCQLARGTLPHGDDVHHHRFHRRHEAPTGGGAQQKLGPSAPLTVLQRRFARSPAAGEAPPHPSRTLKAALPAAAATAKQPAKKIVEQNTRFSQHRSKTLYRRSRDASCRTVPSVAKAWGGNSAHLFQGFPRTHGMVGLGYSKQFATDGRKQIEHKISGPPISYCPRRFGMINWLGGNDSTLYTRHLSTLGAELRLLLLL